ncbi:MAG: hypothetical protein GF347_04305 [Candidatus Moranbacteria bacterium]|nr:hypothetical protein [Candidatus Moranbacteria bacterium]
MKDPLEYLFASKTKLRLLKTLIFNEGISLTLDDFSKRTGLNKKTLQRELKKMIEYGLVKTKLAVDEVSYSVDQNWDLYSELKALIARCSINPSSDAVKAINELGGITYAAFSGVFVGSKKTIVDFFLVGDDLDRPKLEKIISIIEADAGREINYSFMETAELIYRLDLLDKFVKDIIDEKNIVIIDRIQEKKNMVKRRNLRLW